MPTRASVFPREVRSTRTILFAGCEGFRKSISRSLSSSAYRLIIAGSGAEALQRSLEFRGPIDLLLANVEMSDMSGVEFARLINLERPTTESLFLAILASGLLILDDGWHFLPAPFESEMLRARVRDVMGASLPPAEGHVTPERSGELERLTTREAQVLRLIARGNSTKEVASILGIAFKTSVGHRSRLMKKLTIHDSATLVRFAIREGFIDV
jgi:DNA-binding NarL/FixJ family response regulator